MFKSLRTWLVLLLSLLSAELRRNLDGSFVPSDVLSYYEVVTMRMPDALRVKLHIAIDIRRYAYFILYVSSCSPMHDGVFDGTPSCMPCLCGRD